MGRDTPVNKELNELIEEIGRLQDEVEKHWDDLRQQFNYTIEGHKVRFEAEVKKLHKQFKTGAFKYLVSSSIANLITAPVIYSMVFPIALLDATITIYQHICFRAYGIPRVKRSDYIIIDRHQLNYLNIIEKFNCIYCGYGNGLMSYAQEIIARTEQYWCPIKHAQRVYGAHEHYKNFADYGDAENYKKQLSALRKELNDMNIKHPT
jgi:hypothetical protein